MRLMSLELLQSRSIDKKARKNSNVKRIEHSIGLELTETLKELLVENDKVLIEVDARYVGEFINVIDRVKYLAEYSQVDKNLFEFTRNDVSLF